MRKKKSLLETKQIGEILTKKEQKEVGKIISRLIIDASSRRRMLLAHYKLQNIIGGFFEAVGYDVDYEVTFNSGGFKGRSTRFDIIAQSKKAVFVIEVKDNVNPSSVGQVEGYFIDLERTKAKERIYLGTDIINFSKLFKDTLAKMIKNLMESTKAGIILADYNCMIIFHNYDQLNLVEMPEFLFLE